MLLSLPPVIGHRGAAALAPENTLASIKAAARAGVQWIECDVCLTNDAQCVVLHDASVERTTNGHGFIADLSWSAVSQLDAGSWFSPAFVGERIPLLTEVFACAAACQLGINVELKPADARHQLLLERVLQLSAHHWPASQPPLLFSSFDWDLLRQLRAMAPHARIGLLMHEWQAECFSTANALACESIHVNEVLVTPARIDAIRAAGLRSLAYTVNDRTRARQLWAAGVDSVFSDDPSRLQLPGDDRFL